VTWVNWSCDWRGWGFVYLWEGLEGMGCCASMRKYHATSVDREVMSTAVHRVCRKRDRRIDDDKATSEERFHALNKLLNNELQTQGTPDFNSTLSAYSLTQYGCQLGCRPSMGSTTEQSGGVGWSGTPCRIRIKCCGSPDRLSGSQDSGVFTLPLINSHNDHEDWEVLM